MEQIKLVKDHPAFQRVALQLARQVESLRPRTLRLAAHNVQRHAFLIPPERMLERIEQEAARIEYSMLKRMLRQHGFAGKYVAH